MIDVHSSVNILTLLLLLDVSAVIAATVSAFDETLERQQMIFLDV